VAGTSAAIADPAVRAAFREWLLRAADDELVIGHRHSEWTGFGPDIESDVAMSSIAQEEIGHARALYEQAALDAAEDVDRLAFGRSPAEYRHGVLLERENHGWEFSIVRLALYEPFESARLQILGACGQEPVAGLARTLAREERYHALFAQTWLTRLSRATAEGQGKVQGALDAAWPDALGLFEATAADELLQARGIFPQPPASLRAAWEKTLRPMLEELGLTVPAVAPREGGRRGRHTPEFDAMLAEMTEVWRSDPEAKW
jgi:ring-1,2-phenylacetyl-CoA epoxidase subunit PaaC